MGKAVLIDRPVITNQQINSIIGNPQIIDDRFLYYALAARRRQLFALGAGGSRTPILNKSGFESFVIPVAPLREQRAIGETLASFDDKIELNRKRSETLESISRALFQSWLVDFDPVRAKAEGRDPGVPAEFADCFGARLVDSPMGMIPAGWTVMGLDEAGTFLNGLALQKYPVNNGDSLPAIKIAQLRSGTTEGADRVSKSVPPQYHVNDGDVLFSWSGSLDCVVWTSGRGALNQHLFKVTSERYPKWFYLGWIQHYLPAFRRIAAAKATTMGHIQRHHLREALVAVPPVGFIHTVGKYFDAFLQASISAKLQARTLAALRDTLLPKLISGELRVNNIAGAIS